jgi:type VI secretion system protein ImpD
LRTRFPLRSAGITVDEIPGKPGMFTCTVRLQPHFQLDDVSTSFHLIAETANTAQTLSRPPAMQQRMSA